MDEVMETGALGVELGKWMGRREAFGLIAGRCSAAEIESLQRIRDGKLYQQLNCTWEEFCTTQLRVSKRKVDLDIGYLQSYGPEFFALRQLARISVREYASIAPHISEAGVHVDGAVIPLLPEKTEELAGAVQTLLERSEPPASAKGFDAVLRRVRAANQSLASNTEDPDDLQLTLLADEITEMLKHALAFGLRVIREV